jgi:hypothetical protein
MTEWCIFEADYYITVKVHLKLAPLSFYGLTGESSSFLWIARSSMPSTAIGDRAMTIQR